MFFHLGTGDTLARCLADAGFAHVRLERMAVQLDYERADAALGAVFRGGPVVLAYARFEDAAKEAVHTEYLRSISAYRVDGKYRIPGEFVIATGLKPLS